VLPAQSAARLSALIQGAEGPPALGKLACRLSWRRVCAILRSMLDLPTEPCPKCAGTGHRHLPEAGAVLQEHRLERGVTAAAMARELGVTRQLVNDWERGRHRVPQDVPERWARMCRERKAKLGAT
jgi:DNA-binding XRE family transcriptional regulator